MKGMTRIVTLLVALVAVGQTVEVAAQGTPGAARIGYVNVGAALRSMPGWAEAESTYTREFEAVQTELQGLQASLDSAGQAFQQQSAMLSPTNRTARQRELAQQEERFQGRVQELQQQMARREQELLDPMQDRLTAIIDGLRAEGSFAVIFDIGSQAAGLIVSIDRTLDITPRVIERLQQSPGN